MAGTGATSSSSVARLCLMVYSSWRRIRCIQSVSPAESFPANVNVDLMVLGYAGYYGLSLIVGSYPVLFVSIAAHAAQFGFLVFFENPRELLPLITFSPLS